MRVCVLLCVRQVVCVFVCVGVGGCGGEGVGERLLWGSRQAVNQQHQLGLLHSAKQPGIAPIEQLALGHSSLLLTL